MQVTIAIALVFSQLSRIYIFVERTAAYSLFVLVWGSSLKTGIMLKLYQFAPAFGLPNPSNFCLKLETYLRMADIPFESVYGMEMNKAPKGKMPYIEDSGNTIGDSNFIIEYLKQTYGDKLEAHLTPSEIALSLAMRFGLWDFGKYFVGTFRLTAEGESSRVG